MDCTDSIIISPSDTLLCSKHPGKHGAIWSVWSTNFQKVSQDQPQILRSSFFAIWAWSAQNGSSLFLLWWFLCTAWKKNTKSQVRAGTYFPGISIVLLIQWHGAFQPTHWRFFSETMAVTGIQALMAQHHGCSWCWDRFANIHSGKKRLSLAKSASSS